MSRCYELIDRLEREHILPRDELVELINAQNSELSDYLFAKAVRVRQGVYGNSVYIRGLIEISNVCKNDCLYCGIRRSNRACLRYCLTAEEILACCDEGWNLGFRTFVLQGGENPSFTDELLCELLRRIKNAHPDCAVTLSLGERSRDSYERLKTAGADRYLLRHETADKTHYERLHPTEMSYENRIRCLWDLKSLGYQVGCGFMVGSPWQTSENLADDLLFISKLQPEMVGIGPFIPQSATPFADKSAGTLEQTLFLLGLIRLILPQVLLPATTALGTIHPQGRELGILAGANVVMPNLSPQSVRGKYVLYDNKIFDGSESAQCRDELCRRMNAIGYNVVIDRGDHKSRQ